MNSLGLIGLPGECFYYDKLLFLNQDGGAGMSLPGDGAEVVVAPKRHSEEGRGGFVLRAKSDEVPHRRRSLVERTGMKNFVQVRQQRHSTFLWY